ncbi:MAG: hypothetical protein L0H84_07805, partial [Pseudonocardia sp.]|nr:hypothetical protein [Pseudonocardia sp.]
MTAFAAVLAAMPDLLARALAEHVPDGHGRCRECRADDGTSAPWPCAMRLLADEARGITSGRAAGTPRHPVTAQDPTHLPAHVAVQAPVTAPAAAVANGPDT